MDRDRLQAQIDDIAWYHEFDFGNGLKATSKADDPHGHRQITAFIHRELDAIDFRGKTVLDVGCWDGYWSFYAEKRGAAAVLATDDFTQNPTSANGIRLAKQLLGSKIDIDPNRSVYDLASLGRRFDIVLCLGVFYHLWDPYLSFAQVRHCCHPNTVVALEGNLTYGLPANAVLFKSAFGTSKFTPGWEGLVELLAAAYMVPTRRALLHPHVLPEPPAVSEPTDRVGWRWRLRMAAAALGGSRPAIRSAAEALFPPPAPTPPPAPPKPDSRVFVACAPFAEANPLHCYRPPFGLHAYDPRFTTAASRAARPNPAPARFAFSRIADPATTASPTRLRSAHPAGKDSVYKLLLCARYLRTRYLAFVCIVSVMLGVATLIVVNAVMSGFSTKLKDRLHGVLSDVVVDTDRMDGFPERPEEMLAKIKASPAGDRIEAVTPTIEVFAIMQFRFNHQVITKPVRLIGIDPAGRDSVGGFSEYLVNNKHTPAAAFDLSPEALQRFDFNKRQREREDALNLPVPEFNPKPPVRDPNAIPEPKMDIGVGTPQVKLHGVIPGYTIAHYRYRNEQGVVMEEAALRPGDDVTITTVGGAELKPVWGTFIVSDYLKTEMSEYDQSFVYVPLEQLQKIRGMGERCTALQIKLKDYKKDKEFATNELRKLYPYADVRIATWEEHQGPLLAAIDVERGILNLLLFMIVGVAGFSILAIFTMIVSEKYRDIGVLKSLGASSWGVMSIFLGYGLLLGIVGCALGTGLGLLITDRINDIEQFLTELTGSAVFPRDVYYFKDIPTNVDPWVVAIVNVGAIGTAAMFSLLPAYRAARLQPVRALRFE